jgi:5-methylcytosine-specific restriction endonuclease McrA
MLTKAELTPYALELFANLKRKLPVEIGTRLRSNRRVVNHGSYNDFFLFDIWDRHQSDVLHRQHFKYTFAYDPARRYESAHDGYLCLWINTIRLYRRREEVIGTLSSTLPGVTPTGLKYQINKQGISIGRGFDYPADLNDLPGLLFPWFRELITAAHPALIPVIDMFSTSLTPGERRRVVASRGRIEFTPRKGVRDPGRVRENSRLIPKSWKPLLLEKYRHRCFLCRADLTTTKHHFDHWVPFSKGGMTEFSNLRPLCARCNLKKGNRMGGRLGNSGSNNGTLNNLTRYNSPQFTANPESLPEIR